MELDTASRTMKTVRRDFVEWHRGRTPYVFWAIDVDRPEVRAELARAAGHLGELLLENYTRQPHVTLDVCGFPCFSPETDDEFGGALLHGQIDRLRQAGLQSFEIEIGSLDSFVSAPYLAVADSLNRLSAIRGCLAEGGGNRLWGNYVPHVTVGLYADDWPATDVAQRLRAFPDGITLPVRVERINLMSYAPSEIAGELSILGDYWLTTGEMLWHPVFDALGLGAFESVGQHKSR